MKKICAVLLLSVMVLMIFCSCGQSEIESIIMTNSDVTMTVGDTTTLSFVVNPQNASQKGLTWSSSNEGVATVDDGTVKALKEGNATITVMTPKGIKATCNVTVGGVEIQAVTLSASSSTIKVGASTHIDVTVTPATADKDNLDWSSSSADVASVDSDGNVSGLKAGSTTITCMAPNGKKGTCIITVKAKSGSKKTSSSNGGSVVYVFPKNYDYSSDYIISDSDTRLLSDSELSGMNPHTAQMAINEIYARHGRPFKNADVRAYFQSKWWYTENPNYSDSMLSSIENANIKKLTKYR